MVQDITERGPSASQAGASHGVSAVTARKWLGRYLAEGAAGLCDKSSRPARSPRAIAPATALAIVELRRQLFLQARIAAYMGVSRATVSRVLRRAGLSRAKNRSITTSARRLESCCTSTSRGSVGSAIGSPVTEPSAAATSAGNSCSSPLMSTAESPLLRCTRMNARKAS